MERLRGLCGLLLLRGRQPHITACLDGIEQIRAISGLDDVYISLVADDFVSLLVGLLLLLDVLYQMHASRRALLLVQYLDTCLIRSHVE